MPFVNDNLAPHRIWYDTAGESGPPVLLIMGFTMRGTAWRWQIDELSRHHRVAWFDHAGLGESGPLAVRRLRMQHLAQDALSVVDDLGWDDAHVVGLSMGGMIAQHIGLDHRERVRSLTLAATHPGGLRTAIPPLGGLRAFLQIRRAASREERLEALATLLLGRDFREREPERVREILMSDFTQPPPVSTTLAQMHAIARHRTAHRLRELSDLDVMIVRPGEDQLIDPAESDRLYSLLPDARMLRFDDSGHAVTRQYAEEFNEALLRHFATAEEKR